MRSFIWLLPILLLHNPAPLPSRPAARPSISDLAWLEGVWSGRVGGQDFEARYSGPEGGQVLSMSKYSAKGRAAGFEFERFEERDGTILLTPFPGGKGSVTFRLTDHNLKGRTSVFENPAHDFPTKISYQLVAEDSLTILVSGPGKDGKESVLRYALARKGTTK